MKITKQRLKEIIKEELGEAQEESLNPEWDKASKIQSDIVQLGGVLLESKRADWQMALSKDGIAQALRNQVKWLEEYLVTENPEKFAKPPELEEPEKEVSDEEALVLPRLDFDPLGDDPRALKQQKIARRKR